MMRSMMMREAGLKHCFFVKFWISRGAAADVEKCSLFALPLRSSLLQKRRDALAKIVARVAHRNEIVAARRLCCETAQCFFRRAQGQRRVAGEGGREFFGAS